MSAVLSVDPSYTGTGLILLDTDTGKVLNQQLIKTNESLTVIQRVNQIIQEIKNFTAPVTVLDLRVIEGFSFGSANKAHQMGYLGYRIREYFDYEDEYDCLVIEPSPNQVKKFATNKTTAGKELIMKEVYKRWGFDTDNNNLSDAYAMAQIGRAYLGSMDKLTAFQQEVIDSLRGKKKAKKVRKKKVKP